MGGNVRRIAREESSDRLDALEDALTKQSTDRGMMALTEKFPTWQVDAQDPAFLTWVREKKSRIMLTQAADALDFEAAEELLGSYYESKVPPVDEGDANTQQQLNDATLESGSPAPTELVDTYSRNDLLNKRLLAKAGNLEAERWLSAHATSITQAYAEERIVD